MNISEAIQARKSIRGYLSKSVEIDKLKRILEFSFRAPSWKNAQAYKLIVVQGEIKEKLAQQISEQAKIGEVESPDYPAQSNYPPYIKKRMFDLGMAYFQQMGIARDDLDARKQNYLKNFQFFDAPVGIFFLLEKGMNFWPAIDLGILIGNIILAAKEEGLDCIVQASLAAYPNIVRKELNISENWNVAVGMSMGYADPNHIANGLETKRESIVELVEFKGF